jgi:hypothetical protein
MVYFLSWWQPNSHLYIHAIEKDNPHSSRRRTGSYQQSASFGNASAFATQDFLKPLRMNFLVFVQEFEQDRQDDFKVLILFILYILFISGLSGLGGKISITGAIFLGIARLTGVNIS